MGNNVKIIVGGKNRYFSNVNKLGIGLQDGGESFWVDKNNTKADQIIGKDTDGNDYIVTTDIGGNIVKTMLPTEIRVVMRPNKTSYADGETIDYTGMVVMAYDADGNVWTDANHPDGIIPNSELILPNTISRKYDNMLLDKGPIIDYINSSVAEDQGRSTAIELVNNMGSRLMSQFQYKYSFGTDRYGVEPPIRTNTIQYRIASGEYPMYAQTIYEAWRDGTFRPWAAILMPNTSVIQSYNAHIEPSGEEIIYDDVTLNYRDVDGYGRYYTEAFTWDGKRVYWRSTGVAKQTGDRDPYNVGGRSSSYYGYETLENEIPDNNETELEWTYYKEGTQYTKKLILHGIIAWTIQYGGRGVPIQWPRPGDHKVLETYMTLDIE